MKEIADKHYELIQLSKVKKRTVNIFIIKMERPNFDIIFTFWDDFKFFCKQSKIVFLKTYPICLTELLICYGQRT